MIINPDRKIVNENGQSVQTMFLWMDAVSKLDVFIGTGTPESVVVADQGRFYMDDAGVAGSILYIKRDSDVGGDRSQGWILV